MGGLQLSLHCSVYYMGEFHRMPISVSQGQFVKKVNERVDGKLRGHYSCPVCDTEMKIDLICDGNHPAHMLTSVYHEITSAGRNYVRHAAISVDLSLVGSLHVLPLASTTVTMRPR